jgi:hypothetical protein
MIPRCARRESLKRRPARQSGTHRSYGGRGYLSPCGRAAAHLLAVGRSSRAPYHPSLDDLTEYRQHGRRVDSRLVAEDARIDRLVAVAHAA